MCLARWEWEQISVRMRWMIISLPSVWTERLLNRKVGKELEMLAGDSKGLAALKVPARHSVLLTSATGNRLPCHNWPSLRERWGLIARPLSA